MHISHLRALDGLELAKLIATRRAKRGMRFLNRNAPHRWYLNLFHPTPSGSIFRASVRYHDESPLSLPFEMRADLANLDGYVMETQVIAHFKLSPKWLRAHGFSTDPGKSWVSSDLQNSAWEGLLRNIPRGGVYQHRSALDRRLNEIPLPAIEERLSPFEWIFGR